MKRVLSLVLCVLMLLTVFTACSSNGTTATPTPADSSTPAPGTSAPDSSPEAAVNAFGYDLTGCDPIEVLLAHPSPQSQLDTQYTEKWMEKVTEYSDGLITFQYSHSGEMGSLVELIEALEMGVIDMSKPDLSMYGTYVPEVNLFSLPFMVSGWDHAAAVYDGEPGQWLKEKFLEESNTVVLNYFVTGFRCFATTTPINQLSDTEGILMRCPEAEIYISTQTLLGFSPTPISFNEMYTALSTGVVDGIDSAPVNCYEGGYHEIAPYIWYSKQMAVCNSLAANRDFWDGLPQVYRDIMQDAIDELTPLQREESRAAEEGFLQKMADEGATITYPDDYYDEIVSRFQDYWKQTIDNIGGDAQQIVDKIQALA